MSRLGAQAAFLFGIVGWVQPPKLDDSPIFSDGDQLTILLDEVQGVARWGPTRVALDVRQRDGRRLTLVVKRRWWIEHGEPKRRMPAL
jgi:hypothetical protein